MPKKNMNIKKRSEVAKGAWNILRLALLWARKGGVLKRRLFVELRFVPKFIKSLGQNTQRGQLHYFGERELSFDKTPIFHVKMHKPGYMRFNIPCITPQVDFDYDFEHDDGRISFVNDHEAYGIDDDDHVKISHDHEEQEVDQGEEGKGIDMRAEEFIAKFYEQIRLQRQISYLQYHRQ